MVLLALSLVPTDVTLLILVLISLHFIWSDANVFISVRDIPVAVLEWLHCTFLVRTYLLLF